MLSSCELYQLGGIFGFFETLSLGVVLGVLLVLGSCDVVNLLDLGEKKSEML